jgi:nitroimidazol reductase NimA-like FMN-containing flavoprotein (pyridoxamine 5'-phosphate oxidase superfamily)
MTGTNLSGPDATGMIELDAAECWRLLRRSEVGRLAVSIANYPDIFPVNYVVDGESIVFRTAAGTKLAASVLGKGVAFEIDGYDALRGDAWSVVMKGEAHEIEHMMEYFNAEELPLFPWNAAPKPNIVRIDPQMVTGRRFHVVERASLDAGSGHAEVLPAKPYMPPD